MENDHRLAIFKEALVKYAFISGKEQYIHKPGSEALAWLFDLRTLVFQPEFIDLYADVFLDTYKDKHPFQVCGLETAAIPLVAAIVIKSMVRGTPVNGFFIRKSRKKTGLLNMIEGVVHDTPLILVDDLINSGGSFLRQVAVIEQLRTEHAYTKLTILGIHAILRFRDLDAYTYFNDHKIPITSIVTLDDLSSVLPVANLRTEEKKVVKNAFTTLWRWQSSTPSLEQVRPKTTPVFHEGKIYTGTDTGDFVCLDAHTGAPVWKYHVAQSIQRGVGFSTPIVDDDVVYFGSIDGNIYALDALTGGRLWVSFEGDWLGSSLAASHDTLFMTLEHGVFKKHTELVALWKKNGKKRWGIPLSHKRSTSLSYAPEQKRVICGTEDGTLAAYSAETGAILWSQRLPGSIVAAPTVDEGRNIVAVGTLQSDKASTDAGSLVLCDLRTGSVLRTFTEFSFGSYATPLIYKNVIIFTSLDKHVYAVDIDSLMIVWKHNTGARIFATPVLIETPIGPRVYVGSNSGVLYEIEPQTGVITSQTFVTERITSCVAYDQDSHTLFLPTYANEIYALRRNTVH
jgi:outer membrane protein assembly factor BamB/adenine/guanine phosphoribosyltransferase-like PRPP-binding protein